MKTRLHSARVANDLTDRVVESRRMLEREIRSVLDRATVSAERALENARKAQHDGTSAIARELSRLVGATERIERLVRAAPDN